MNHRPTEDSWRAEPPGRWFAISARNIRMSPVALIVDPDWRVLPALGELAARAGWTPVVETTFVAARRELEMKGPAALIAKVRLGMFNAIQLGYLTKLKTPSARVILYGDDNDAPLGAEVQAAHGFYERTEFVQHSLASYLRAQLPETDRRNVWAIDRRTIFRGGRRATDSAHVRRSVTAV